MNARYSGGVLEGGGRWSYCLWLATVIFAVGGEGKGKMKWIWWALSPPLTVGVRATNQIRLAQFRILVDWCWNQERIWWRKGWLGRLLGPLSPTSDTLELGQI